jgi:hypothetical protein
MFALVTAIYSLAAPAVAHSFPLISLPIWRRPLLIAVQSHPPSLLSTHPR